MEGLKVVAGCLILVHTREPVTEQGALDIINRGWTCAFNIDGHESLVNLAVKAEGRAGHGYSLGLSLSLIANRFVGCHGVEHSSLRSGQA